LILNCQSEVRIFEEKMRNTTGSPWQKSMVKWKRLLSAESRKIWVVYHCLKG